MADLTINRSFKAPPETVFAYITRTEHLLKWWGHDGATLPEYQLAFDKKGPWMSTMLTEEGNRYKMSGHVTHVDPPRSIGFTWAWHDENDRRGVESHVTIKLVPAQNGGTDFELRHVDLPEGAEENHERGWGSTLKRLERLIENSI